MHIDFDADQFACAQHLSCTEDGVLLRSRPARELLLSTTHCDLRRVQTVMARSALRPAPIGMAPLSIY